MHSHLIEKDLLIAYLELLAQELAAREQMGEMLLGDEAVMVLIVGSRKSLRRLTASFGHGSVAMRDAADQLAWKTGLPASWLDGDFKDIHALSPSASLWRKYPGLEIYHPALDYLLARKVIANRFGDRADALALAQRLHIHSPKLIIQLLQRYISSHDLTPHVQYRVAEWFG